MCEYTLFDHRHNFAVWAAARASQRAFTTVENLRDALEGCGIVEVLKDHGVWPSTSEEFDDLHKEWCRSAKSQLDDLDVENATYGRAAKLVAVYLKAMIVVAGYDDTDFAKVLHPPIDRLLLQALARDEKLDKTSRKEWRKINWTQLDEDAYFKLINDLRQHELDQPCFWELERYWNVTS